jgi:hypothetical protein
MPNGESNMKLFSLIFLLGLSTSLFCQYAPKVGVAGSTAINKDSSIFVNWANQCTVVRGWQDISDKSLGYTTVGDSISPTGIAGENGVVSLGDGGYVVCTFPAAIKNGAGFDFAVFENAFDDEFLELAFVEVSSDGENFFRFPAHSLTDTAVQTESFGYTDATKINNLAGKYRGGYGTPFDLNELANVAGLDIDNVTHVKIVDVVGSINDLYATRVTAGNKVNDPFPTPFPSGGFDLDAIGVIHQQPLAITDVLDFQMKFFPNPVQRGGVLQFQVGKISTFEIVDIAGKTIVEGGANVAKIPLNIDAGCYVLKIKNGNLSKTKLIVIE